MFTVIGRFFAWYPFNFPAIRRLAKQNPTDIGKLFVYGWLMNVAVIGGYIIGLKWLAKKAFADPTFDEDEARVNGTAIENLDSVFEERFGTLHKGDTVIYKYADQHIEGVFIEYQGQNLVIEVDPNNEVIVPKSEVLDVTPAF